MRPVLAVLAALMLSACSGSAAPDSAAPGSTAPPSTAPGPGAPGSATAPVGGDIALDAECTSPEGFTVAHPAGWAVNAGDVVPYCTRFAPEPFEVRPGSDVRMSSIVLTVEDVALAARAAPAPDEVTRTDVAVDGRPGVRQVLVTGPGLHPAGTRITRYLVDLGDGRTLVADVIEFPDTAAPQTVAVLDAMMSELDIGGYGQR